MDILGEYRIKASRQAVWEALNDPDVLCQCIPGCEQLRRDDDGSFNATINAKVGPVNARFKTTLRLENLKAPDSYTLVGEGKGGAAGFGKGSADVALAESGSITILSYNAKFSVGGKLAQVGSRLVQGAARKIADQFFMTFAERLGGEPIGDKGAHAGPGNGLPPQPIPMARRPATWGWVAVVVIVLVVGWMVLS